ncbi:UPF0182 family protein [Gemmatimonadota bacterium]
MSDSQKKAWRGGKVLLLVAVSVGAALLLGRAVASLFVEVLWFDSVGYGSVFWTRTLAEGGMRVLAGVVTALLAFLNFRIVATTLSDIQIKRRFGNLEIAERIPRSTIRWGVTMGALLLGLWLGASFPRGAGLRLLLLLNAPSWGLPVPPLGRDASFFVFSLPILGGLLIFGLGLTFLLFAFSAAGYAATGSLTFRGGRPTLAPLPRKHLALLGAVFLFLLAGRIWIGQYLLFLDGNSGVQGIMGFSDAHARIPGYRALGLLTGGAGILVWWAGFRRRTAALVGGGVAVLLGGLILVQLYPEVVQRFQVEPNELERETPFIEANLHFTRVGFGLEGLERRDYDYGQNLQPDWPLASGQFAGLPVWTTDALLTTFQAVEARFPYYDFEEVAIDRYPSAQGLQPVALAVREIDPAGIGDPNWQNLHLRTRFLAGQGAVASAASSRTPEGRPPMFLSGIPPVFSDDPSAPPALRMTEPSVYFGSRPQLYAILNPDSLGSVEAQGRGSGEERLGRVEPRGPTGVQGIRIGNPLRTLALAWRFRDPNLFFSSEVSRDSHFVFRRQVVERAAAIAPFLRFLEAPYPVLFDGRVVWILEAFTFTRSFPLSSPQELPGSGSATYLRNSVKVTVDGVTGDVRFYRIDDEDPLLSAWSGVFPDLFLSLEEMPQALRDHLRYPRQLLGLQARVLLQYHQETAPRFHRQQDVWALPQELAQGTRPVPYVPEYGSYRLPGQDKEEFLLSTVFVPAGRQNLTGLLVARCDPERYGELLLFDIPVEEQVPGPRQVEALVEQDPVISQQFSLWRQGGSQVWSGHLHVVPVGQTLLYMEPIFLAAEADAIPELRRFVVSDGRRVAMEPSLGAAIEALTRTSSPSDPEVPVSPLTAQEVSTPVGGWPREALDLLEEAEARLREGDWNGFGQALDELRALLRRLSEGGEGG